MFGRRHNPEALADRIDQLMKAVFIREDRERLERLAEELAPDFVYISPQSVFDGVEGLSEAFSRFRRGERPPTSLRRTSVVDIHHGHFRYSWARTEGSDIAMEGWSFGWMNAAGLISWIVAFDGLLPGPPS